MKNALLLFICLSLAATCNPVLAKDRLTLSVLDEDIEIKAKTYQLFSLTGLTAVEYVDHEWTAPATVDLGYNLIRPFRGNSGLFYAVGINMGISFNSEDQGTIRPNVIAAAYVGGQPFKGLPAMAIGPGYNLVTGNPMIVYTLHFAPTEVIKSITPAAPTYKPLLSSDAYKRNNIGFNKDPKPL